MGERAGLYVHVPFCHAVCPYCDFAVTPLGRAAGERRKERFVACVVRELALAAARRDPLGPIDTVYFGGGTPSLLAAPEVARILAAARASLEVEANASVFLEANPEDATPARLAPLRAAGVATLSLGVQSLDPAALRFLGRTHTPDDARRSVAGARAAGFDTVSVDLIYGLPGDTPERVVRDVDDLAALAPDHVSAYQLSMPEGTRLGKRLRRGEVEEIGESDQAALFRLVHERLEARGFAAYEVSNFATAPRHRSRHNVKYWRHAPYLGVGPSAHSFAGDRRWWNERSFGTWAERVDSGAGFVAAEERIGPRERALEAVMLGLRTRDGVDLARLRADTGLDLVARNPRLVEELAAGGLVRVEGAWLRPTLDGWAIADALAARFEIELAPEKPALPRPARTRPESSRARPSRR